jgi:trimeric autotransporter adhesin
LRWKVYFRRKIEALRITVSRKCVRRSTVCKNTILLGKNAMSHAFKFCVIAISVALGMGDRALAQCFLCSDSNNNTSSGTDALYADTGSRNSASGAYAMYSNTTGVDNTAVGYQGLYLNTIGYRNSAIGGFALAANTSGNLNNAIGYGAMAYNTTGSNNNAQGYLALENNTTGSYNIAIGEYAGYNLTTGSSNIDIGNEGAAGESAVIRIGSAATATYIAGISTSTVTGAAVYVTSAGRLGVLASSERYKTSIKPIGSTAKLEQLHPVTFRLKNDPRGAVQYGLIAEEVDKVYPELVIRDEAGTIQGIRYEELTPMLLNEMQEQQQKIAVLDARAAAQDAEIRDLKKLVVQMQADVIKLQAKDELVAQR